MKKIFLTIAVLFTVMFNMFGQETENLKLNFKLDNGMKFDTIINVSTTEQTEVFITKNIHVNANYALQEPARNIMVTKTLLVEPTDAGEALHNLNYGVNKFAILEIASLCVGVGGTAIGVAIPLIAKAGTHSYEGSFKGSSYYSSSNTAATVGYVVIGTSCLAAAVLQVCALLELKNNSMDNFYISEHGIGFKIDIK